ncbi:MAG: hypothetical protein R3E10_14910 [Gemmatimonadota bacterium]
MTLGAHCTRRLSARGSRRAPRLLRTLSALALGVAGAAIGGCTTFPDKPVVFNRLDGIQVSCVPPSPEAQELEGAAIGNVMSDITQRLKAGGSPDANVEALARIASTPERLEVLRYRVCLEYGKDVLSGDAYAAWTDAILPRLQASLERGGSE